MYRSLLSAAVAFGLCISFDPVFAGIKKAQFIRGWGVFVDPDGDCKVKEQEGKVIITVPKTHHDLTYTDQFTKLNAPRILQNVHGDFVLQVKVHPIPLPGKNTSSSGAHSFVSSGLLVWQDDKNFIRLDRAAEGNGGSQFLWIERFTKGRPETQEGIDVLNNPIHLRVTRSGNKFTFSYSPNGQDWVEAHKEDVKLSNDLQVGVLAINTTTSDFSPQFEGLEVRGEKKSKAQRPEGFEELKALDNRWWERGRQYLAAIKDEPSQEKQTELATRMLPVNDPKAVEEFFDLEKKYRGKDIGLFSLNFILMCAAGVGDPDTPVVLGRQRALDILREHYWNHQDLDHLFESFRGGPILFGSDRLFEVVAQKSPHEHVRAAALFHHADQLARIAQHKILLEDLKRRQANGEQLLGRGFHDSDRKTLLRMATFDEKQARKDAVTLARRVMAEYPDAVGPWRAVDGETRFLPRRFVPGPGGDLRKRPTYAERAESLLFQMDQLVVGQAAPALGGTDSDGKEFRLSDCKGNVVVLMFSANWCAPCKHLYPELRELQKKFDGKPVMVVTVMADADVKTVREAIAKGDITWRAVWDGAQGPIALKWNVTSFPTIYVFDALGITRARNVSNGPALQNIVAGLLKERE